MVPQVSADDAQRRSDQAVRRLREESARRIDRCRRVRAFSSWCALATLAGGISLGALSAHEAQERLQADESAEQLAAATRHLLRERLELTRRTEAQEALQRQLREQGERQRIRAEAELAKATFEAKEHHAPAKRSDRREEIVCIRRPTRELVRERERPAPLPPPPPGDVTRLFLAQ